MENLPDVWTFSRGLTRIHLRRTADGGYLLRVNDGEPTPIRVYELAEMLSHWTRILRQAGIPIARP